MKYRRNTTQGFDETDRLRETDCSTSHGIDLGGSTSDDCEVVVGTFKSSLYIYLL